MSSLRSSVLRKPKPAPRENETPHDVLYRAERARQLLDDPVLVEAFAGVEIDQMEAAIAARNDDDRRAALDMVKAVREVRSKIKAHVDAAERKAREAVRLP